MQLIFKYRYIVCCLPNLFFKSSDAIRMNSYYINCTCDLVTESSADQSSVFNISQLYECFRQIHKVLLYSDAWCHV